jgi:hypothetical protein
MVEGMDTSKALTQTHAPAEFASCVPVTTMVSVWLVFFSRPDE